MRRTFVCAVIMMTVMTSPSARAEPFYKGKTLSLICGAGIGGGHDIYARALAKYLGRHIPGNPTVVMKTMEGAGSRRAADYIANVASKDGTEIGALTPESVTAAVFEPNKVRYSIRSFEPLGSSLAGSQMCITPPTSTIRTLEDMQGKTVRFSSNAPGGSPSNYAFMIRNLTGQDPERFLIMQGYNGMPQMLLAAERGETDGVCGIEWTSLKSIRPEWVVGSDRAHILVQTGPIAHKPVPGWKSVPDMRDYMNAANRVIAEFIAGEQQMSRPYFAPAGVSEDQLVLLRDGIKSTWEDREFLAEAKRLNIDIEPVAVETIKALLRDYSVAPPALVERARNAMK